MIHYMSRRRAPGPGRNGGPPLAERPHVPPWRWGGFKTFFEWRAARSRAWSAPLAIVRRPARKAQEAGVSYGTYVLELLERGNYLQAPPVPRQRG